MNQAVESFFQGKRFAIVGVSRTGKKFGNKACTELQERGCSMLIVHPQAKEIGGQPCYPSLSALPVTVDGLIVCVPPEQAKQVLRDAAQAGVTKVWLQPGAQSEAVLALASELGLTTIAGKCILMYAPPVRSVHRLHRKVVDLFVRE